MSPSGNTSSLFLSATVMGRDGSLTLQLVERSAAATRDQQWDVASALWERVIELNPVRAEYWFQLATCRAQQGAYESAIQAFERARSLGARYPWECAYRIASCAARAGAKDRAARDVPAVAA